MSIDHTALFRRDGRLSDLTLELYLGSELSDAERLAVESHLATHADEQRRLSALQTHQTNLQLTAPITEAKVLAFPRAAMITVLALAAAAALWMMRPNDPTALPPVSTDGIRIKSAALDFEVFVHDGAAQRKVQDGATVAPGDRVGFRVKARGASHVLVAGIDQVGAPYPCWPPSGTSAPWTHDDPVVLDRAMRLDTTPGIERFVAIRCPLPFAFEAVTAALQSARSADWRAPPALGGCTVRVVRLEKR